MHIICTEAVGRRPMDMTRVRLIDHLLTEPSTPLALAQRTDEGWEPLHPRPRGLLAAVVEVLFAVFGDERPLRRARRRRARMST